MMIAFRTTLPPRSPTFVPVSIPLEPYLPPTTRTEQTTFWSAMIFCLMFIFHVFLLGLTFINFFVVVFLQVVLLSIIAHWNEIHFVTEHRIRPGAVYIAEFTLLYIPEGMEQELRDLINNGRQQMNLENLDSDAESINSTSAAGGSVSSSSSSSPSSSEIQIFPEYHARIDAAIYTAATHFNPDYRPTSDSIRRNWNITLDSFIPDFWIHCLAQLIVLINKWALMTDHWLFLVVWVLLTGLVLNIRVISVLITCVIFLGLEIMGWKPIVGFSIEGKDIRR